MKHNRTHIMGFLSFISLLLSLILCIIFLKLRIENYITSSILFGGSFFLLFCSGVFGLIGIIKPKKGVIGKVFCIASLLFLSTCIYLSDNLIFVLFAEKLQYKHNDLINTGKVLNVDLSKVKYQKRVETHGGFLGDGEYFSIISFTKDNDISELLNNNSEWNKLPLPKELSELLYTSDENDDFDFAMNRNIKTPNFKNGLYFFLNRQGIYDEKDASKIYINYSFNLTIAIYDSDNYLLYYYEFDT